MSTRQEARESLSHIGRLPDEAIDLAEAALTLARLTQPTEDLAPYREHLETLGREVGEAAGAEPDVEKQSEALRRVLVGQYGYAGDQLTYDNIQNANLLRVIDRRKGLPVALGILFMAAARANGWNAVGLNFPGHFLIRLEARGERSIIDPFNEGQTRTVADLRDLLKIAAGTDAELAPEHYRPVGNREILLRLQNNLKLRLIRAERIDQAAEVVESMLLIAPAQAGLWREAGLLYAHSGNLPAAIAALDSFMTLSPDDSLKQQTARLLQQLKNRLN